MGINVMIKIILSAQIQTTKTARLVAGGIVHAMKLLAYAA